jgi:hypothetical protein
MLTETVDGEIVRDPIELTIYRGRVADLTISGIRVAVLGPSIFGGRIHFSALAAETHQIYWRGRKEGQLIRGRVEVPSIQAQGTFSVRKEATAG